MGIGTIPLRQYINTFAPPPVTVENPPAYEDIGGDVIKVASDTAPSAPPPPDQFTLYPDLPPPTYSESIWGTSNMKSHDQDQDQHTMGDWDFVPRYVTYNTDY